MAVKWGQNWKYFPINSSDLVDIVIKKTIKYTETTPPGFISNVTQVRIGWVEDLQWFSNFQMSRRMEEIRKWLLTTIQVIIRGGQC